MSKLLEIDFNDAFAWRRWSKASIRIGLAGVGLAMGLLLCSVSAIQAKDRVKLFDITFPQPKKGEMDRLSDIQIRTRRKAPSVFASTAIIFHISKKGKVDSIGWSHAASDSLLFRPYQKSLMRTKFEPGKIKGKKSKFNLVAKFYALGENVGVRGIVELPVNSSGNLVDYSLALQSLANYGYTPAELKVFPDYFFLRPEMEGNQERLYQFVVIKVTVDSSGGANERSIYYTTNENLGDMILTATGWADFSPAVKDGKKIAGNGFLLVKFFREIPYPAGPWNHASNSSDNLALEQRRVSWIPGDQFGDVRPVQKASRNLSITIPLTFSHSVEKTATLRIDSKGRHLVTNVSGISNRTEVQLTLDKLKLTQFYPGFRLMADSLNSQKSIGYLNFLGMLQLVPFDSSTYLLNTEFIDALNALDRRSPTRR